MNPKIFWNFNKISLAFFYKPKIIPYLLVDRRWNAPLGNSLQQLFLFIIIYYNERNI